MQQAPASILATRVDSLRSSFEALEIDAVLITHLPNVFYLTNFGGSAAVAVVSRAGLALVTDSRYLAELETGLGTVHPSGLELVRVERTYDHTVAAVVKRDDWRKIGFEAARLTYSRVRWLEQTLEACPRLVPTEGLVEASRVKKDAHEIDLLRRAGRLIVNTASQIVEEIRPDMSERDLAAEIDWRLRQAGFDRPAFETIVASGPNAGFPHARPSDRRLQRSDLVVLDFGGVYSGYCVDLTRTVSVGHPGANARELFDAVRTAQRAALDAVRPGVRAAAVDQAARDSLTTRGLGEAFGHSTGHGIGIEVHEDPKIGRHSDDVVASGMVFTIEPGVYLAGQGGVRVEDDVLVTETGAEVLTQGLSELVVV